MIHALRLGNDELAADQLEWLPVERPQLDKPVVLDALPAANGQRRLLHALRVAARSAKGNVESGIRVLAAPATPPPRRQIRNDRFGSGSAALTSTTFFFRHSQLAVHAAQAMRRAANPPVHLVLGLDQQLGQDEVRLGHQLALLPRRHLHVGDEPAHERRRLLAVAIPRLQQLDPGVDAGAVVRSPERS